jgi:hypothetical protein
MQCFVVFSFVFSEVYTAARLCKKLAGVDPWFMPVQLYVS